MNKPTSLRRAIEAALPDVKANPDKLKVFIDEGQVVSTGTASLSFEYGYTINIIVTDYGDHPNLLMLATLVWLRSHQPEMLRNKDLMRDGFKFEAEQISHKVVDIAIKLKLTERVRVSENGQQLVAECLPEPVDQYDGWTWELLVRDTTDGSEVWPTT